MMRSHRDMQGFTLIEIIVVMAIIAILTGIMVPMVYRVWESQEEELTKQRMRELKIALVGDSRLVQNGVRSHFGYVGDVGQLPTSLGALAANSDGAANWNGPYLLSGYDPAEYDQDAWGSPISYTPVVDGTSRRVAATLRSAGRDGISGTSDDLVPAESQIQAEEAVPVASLTGNINITFQTAPTAIRTYYTGVMVQYRNGSGATAAVACCDPVIKTIAGSPGNTQANYSQAYSCTPPFNLPAGIIRASARLAVDGACSIDLGGVPTEVLATVSGSALYLNLQVQSVP